MKPNINDRSKLEGLKVVLAERNVSSAAIATIERALKNGMSFARPEDLALLSIPTPDVDVIGEAVDFGTATVAVPNIKTVEYTFFPVGDASFFFGYQLIVTAVNADGVTFEQSYPVETTNRVMVDYDLSDVLERSSVVLRVNTAQGKHARIRIHNGEEVPKDEVIEFPVSGLRNAGIDVAVEELEHAENPQVTAPYPVKGKVISSRAGAKMDGYQVVILAATAPISDGTEPEYTPAGFATTETNGYFVTGPLLFANPADIGRVTAAKAFVAKDDVRAELAVRLEVSDGDDIVPRTSRIPRRLILILAEGEPGEAVPVGGCGCGDLNFHQKKVLEEYSYYTVVRTSEPAIIADVLEEEREIDLQDIYGVPGRVPISMFRKYHALQGRHLLGGAQLHAAATAIRAAPTSAPVPGSAPSAVKSAAFNSDLMNRLLVEQRVKTVIKGDAKPVFKGRTHLTQLNQIDWDDEPTIYQAASIAHGHLLHFKQEWMPDGYSIGDLVYSLPLAPGQKKQIAVLDWERRESAANTQRLDYEESLSNTLVRDRDVNDVVSGTLTENIRGNSRASTGGIGFGLGSSVMGIIPGVGSLGSLLGISGGTSSSGSSASSSATRDSTASSLQSITDRTQQAASVVRSQRATVVQTVSQGERVQATSESVANYNHCHTITIQYFQVLRHFAVSTRLAGVQECLFVPLQMTPFDLEKCLRWRNSLEKYLFRRELRPGFDAAARIQNEKESAFENYYDSIGYPRTTYAEQAITSYVGELFLEFFFFNTKNTKIDDEIVAFYSFFGISLDRFRDRTITDDELAEHVGPRTIEYLLDAFTVETDKGVDLRVDLTLLSTFHQNAVLRVSLRQSPTTRTDVPRDRIDGINIKLDVGKLSGPAADNLRQFQNKYLKSRLRSGSLRYRTANFAGTLFDSRIDNDIFAGGDGAYITTPLTAGELRNPRGEDVSATNNLIHHLNENLEYYHKCLFFDMTPERRFMLLDGIIAPGKALGRSVASVVENRVIGIAGNSLILPVAPGYQLDPTIDETFDLFAQYYHEEPDPIRISLPTKGIYAEAVMGECNSCEEKDESRFWRWEESPIPDSPATQILPVDTGTRRADPGNLQPKDFPAPVVNIQNAPSVPDPAGLQKLIELLGKGDAFRDLTGLTQNQLNALATFNKTMETAQSFGKEAAELAKAAMVIELAKGAQKSGALSNEDTKAIVKKQLDPDDQAKAKAAEREQERDDTTKDVQAIEQSKQKDQLDDGQAKEMTEDRIRKGQDTTKPMLQDPKVRRLKKLTRQRRDENGNLVETQSMEMESVDNGFAESDMGDPSLFLLGFPSSEDTKEILEKLRAVQVSMDIAWSDLDRYLNKYKDAAYKIVEKADFAAAQIQKLKKLQDKIDGYVIVIDRLQESKKAQEQFLMHPEDLGYGINWANSTAELISSVTVFFPNNLPLGSYVRGLFKAVPNYVNAVTTILKSYVDKIDNRVVAAEGSVKFGSATCVGGLVTSQQVSAIKHMTNIDQQAFFQTACHLGFTAAMKQYNQMEFGKNWLSDIEIGTPSTNPDADVDADISSIVGP